MLGKVTARNAGMIFLCNSCYSVSLFAMVCLILLNACSTPSPSLISAQSISKYSLSKEANGLSVAVDPYYDKQRVERELGWELPDGILPIFVVIENHSPSAYLLEKAQFTLHSAQSKKESLVPAQPPTASTSLTKTEIASRIVGTVGYMVPIIVIPALVILNKEQDTRLYATYNIWLNEFPDKTVFSGESVQGFVYMPVGNNAYAAAENKELHVVIKNTKTDSATTFVFPISQHKPEEN